MLGAGHETTATGLAFAFELLLRNPSVLGRLREELGGGVGDAYLDAVVKETLRLRPVILIRGPPKRPAPQNDRSTGPPEPHASS